jgi:hypothetical protein
MHDDWQTSATDQTRTQQLKITTAAPFLVLGGWLWPGV